MMQLGFVSAILPDLSLEQVFDVAASIGYRGKSAILPDSDHLLHNFATEPESMRNFQKGTFNVTFVRMMKD